MMAAEYTLKSVMNSSSLRAVPNPRKVKQKGSQPHDTLGSCRGVAGTRRPVPVGGQAGSRVGASRACGHQAHPAGCCSCSRDQACCLPHQLRANHQPLVGGCRGPHILYREEGLIFLAAAALAAAGAVARC